ncbi:hypothetical protein DRN79_02235, partial [Methanosarcinales archaeon]
MNNWSAVFNIYANYTSIRGFTIRNGSMGILLEASHCNISNNDITGNSIGIYASASSL